MREIKIKESIKDLKVGDKVWIRDDLELYKDYGGLKFLYGEMSCVLGKLITIVNFRSDDIQARETMFWYSEDMIDWDKTNGIDSSEFIRTEQPSTIKFDAEFDSQFFDLEVKFAKINEDAKIPSKNDEDAGFDLYASFEEDYIKIEPNSMVLVPTGIKSSYPKEYMALIKERGSTGTKCMSVRAGVMDSGFRNEWKVVINNTSDKTIYIVKNHDGFKKALLRPYEIEYTVAPLKSELREKYTMSEYMEYKFEKINDRFVIYPYSKAIAQFLFIPVPKVKVTEVNVEEVDNDESIRGQGMLGSSGK